MNDDRTTTPHRRSGWIALLLGLVVVGLLAWQGWRGWRARTAQADAAIASTEQRLAALEESVNLLRDGQRKQTQRLQDAVATNRVLRDEVLGLGQRGALLEESVAKLTDPNRHGAQALRLDEVELLLSQASQRMAIAHDVEGARRAYALAAGALEGVDDHRLLNLKQTLAQERAALDALGEGPQAERREQLDAFADGLAKWPRERPEPAIDAQRPAWQRLLSPLVDVRPSRDGTLIAPAERGAAEAALQIELSLARAALERGDQAAFAAALNRVEAWLPRLWPDSPAMRQGRAQLQALRQAPAGEPGVSGSTLQQLRTLRQSATPFRLPPPAPATDATEVP